MHPAVWIVMCMLAGGCVAADTDTRRRSDQPLDRVNERIDELNDTLSADLHLLVEQMEQIDEYINYCPELTDSVDLKSEVYLSTYARQKGTEVDILCYEGTVACGPTTAVCEADKTWSVTGSHTCLYSNQYNWGAPVYEDYWYSMPCDLPVGSKIKLISTPQYATMEFNLADRYGDIVLHHSIRMSYWYSDYVIDASIGGVWMNGQWPPNYFSAYTQFTLENELTETGFNIYHDETLIYENYKNYGDKPIYWYVKGEAYWSDTRVSIVFPGQ